VGDIDVLDDEIRVDGHVALWLPRPAARLALSDLTRGDVARVVIEGAAPDDGSVR
jgi:hypothetical protein